MTQYLLVTVVTTVLVQPVVFMRFSRTFRSDSVFIDVDGIAPGEDFIDAMEQAVGKCEILIAVIGKRWLSISNESGKRLIDNPYDFVRIEIAAALKRGILSFRF
jgi:hypothetical protein